jgi:hypothetical protein
MIVRVLYNKNGGVSIVYPAEKSRRAGEDEKDWLARVFDKANPDKLPHKDIDLDKTQLPNPRFRNTWTKGANGVKVDLAKAKKQVMTELRIVRDKELTHTDGLIARANEIGPQSEIDKLVAYRQKLRDLPQTIGVENAETVEELEVIFPRQLLIDNYLDLADL